MQYDWFSPELEAAFNAAEQPGQPILNVWVYVTRSKDIKNTQICVAGKPNFSEIFATIAEQNPGKAAHVFACGPAMLGMLCPDLHMGRSF